jgi:hypothetical protein
MVFRSFSELEIMFSQNYTVLHVGNRRSARVATALLVVHSVRSVANTGENRTQLIAVNRMNNTERIAADQVFPTSTA